MDINKIYKDKKHIVENMFSRGYKTFEKDIEKDKNYSLSTDEIVELFYDLVLIELKNNNIIK